MCTDMATTTDERRALGDWAAEMMGWKPFGEYWLDEDDHTHRGASLVSWAGMGLLCDWLTEQGREWSLDAFRAWVEPVEVQAPDGDVPLAAFQAAREAIGGAK